MHKNIELLPEREKRDTQATATGPPLRGGSQDRHDDISHTYSSDTHSKPHSPLRFTVVVASTVISSKQNHFLFLSVGRLCLPAYTPH
jgi:hypothetical protein